MITLGPLVVASGWFAKGFFTKVGEKLGNEVGEDVANTYRRFKKSLLGVIREKRLPPPEQLPITMMTLTIDRPGGGSVEIEGSTRDDGGELEEFLDSGRNGRSLLLANRGEESA